MANCYPVTIKSGQAFYYSVKARAVGAALAAPWPLMCPVGG
jgi:hypothetical protein